MDFGVTLNVVEIELLVTVLVAYVLLRLHVASLDRDLLSRKRLDDARAEQIAVPHWTDRLVLPAEDIKRKAIIARTISDKSSSYLNIFAALLFITGLLQFVANQYQSRIEVNDDIPLLSGFKVTQFGSVNSQTIPGRNIKLGDSFVFRLRVAKHLKNRNVTTNRVSVLDCYKESALFGASLQAVNFIEANATPSVHVEPFPGSSSCVVQFDWDLVPKSAGNQIIDSEISYGSGSQKIPLTNVSREIAVSGLTPFDSEAPFAAPTLTLIGAVLTTVLAALLGKRTERSSKEAAASDGSDPVT